MVFWPYEKITTAHSELLKVLFLAPSVCGVLFLYAISREPLNGFALKTRKTRLVPRSDEIEGEGQRLKVKVTKDKKRHFSSLSAACVRFMFGNKTYLACSFNLVLIITV